MENQNQYQDPNDQETVYEEDHLKHRHGCVTAWLIFMMVANGIVGLVYIFQGQQIADYLPPGVTFAEWARISLIVLALLNLYAAYLLYNYKKLGFWIFVFSSLAALAINTSMGMSISSSISGLLGVAILYGILQIQREGKTAWEQLD